MLLLCQLFFLPYVTHQHFNPSPDVKRRREIEKFINENFEPLKEQIAKGKGEHLDTLAVLFELKNVNLWKEHLQNNFENIYKNNKTQKEIVNHISSMTNQEFKSFKVYTVEDYNTTIPLP